MTSIVANRTTADDAAYAPSADRVVLRGRHSVEAISSGQWRRTMPRRVATTRPAPAAMSAAARPRAGSGELPVSASAPPLPPPELGPVVSPPLPGVVGFTVGVIDGDSLPDTVGLGDSLPDTVGLGDSLG
ncbi:MAG: hypothetical protein ACRCSN_22480, partial [Dermatophilaceae bacterium]